MELRHLRYFVVVAEELHFARAAERLHIVQPALSMQIKALEQMLGAQLLRRTKRRVELTEAGRLFLHEARRTLEQVDRAAMVARRAAQGELGRIEVGYTGLAAYSGLLSSTIKAFRHHAPEVELEFHALRPQIQLESLRTGRIQIGITSITVLPAQDDIRSISIGSSRLQIALPATHSLAGYDEIPAAALSEEPFIVHGSASDELGGAFIRRILGFEPLIRHYAANTIMAVSLVAAGLGIALVPEAISAITLGQNVVYRSVAGSNQLIDIALAYHRDENTPCVRRLLSLVQESKATVTAAM